MAKHTDNPCSCSNLNCADLNCGRLDGVTSVEPGCTCGGTAACQQCQDRDAEDIDQPMVVTDAGRQVLARDDLARVLFDAWDAETPGGSGREFEGDLRLYFERTADAVIREWWPRWLCQRHQAASPTRIPCAACSQEAVEAVLKPAVGGDNPPLALVRDVRAAMYRGGDTSAQTHDHDVVSPYGGGHDAVGAQGDAPADGPQMPEPDAVAEARFEVKAAVEEWFSDVSLDDLFAVKGWA